MKYFNDKTDLEQCIVWWELFKDKKSVAQSAARDTFYSSAYARSDSYQCFSSLWGCRPLEQTTMKMWWPVKICPYDEKRVQRWVRAINALGFHCSYDGIKDEKYYVTIDLKQHETRAQLFSTLTLIRCLYESYSATVPARYFIRMDKKENAGRFQELQNAHKETGAVTHLGHNLIDSNYSHYKNLKLEELFEAFKKQPDAQLNLLWRGNA